MWSDLWLFTDFKFDPPYLKRFCFVSLSNKNAMVFVPILSNWVHFYIMWHNPGDRNRKRRWSKMQKYPPNSNENVLILPTSLQWARKLFSSISFLLMRMNAIYSIHNTVLPKLFLVILEEGVLYFWKRSCLVHLITRQDLDTLFVA